MTIKRLSTYLPPGYQQGRRFSPADPKEHEAICSGKDVYNGTPIYDCEDFCTCGAAYNSHYNGHCPK